MTIREAVRRTGVVQLSGFARDLGSPDVLLALLMVGLTWLCLLWDDLAGVAAP